MQTLSPPIEPACRGACFAVRGEKGADSPCDRLSRQTSRCRVHGGFRDHALSAVLDDALMGDRASGCRWPGFRASNAPPGSYSLDSSVAGCRGPSVTDVAHVLCCMISSLSDRLPVHRCTRSCLQEPCTLALRKSRPAVSSYSGSHPTGLVTGADACRCTGLMSVRSDNPSPLQRSSRQWPAGLARATSRVRDALSGDVRIFQNENPGWCREPPTGILGSWDYWEHQDQTRRAVHATTVVTYTKSALRISTNSVSVFSIGVDSERACSIFNW
jgi:hypothetical protein